MSDDKSPEKRSRFKGVWETLNKPFVIYILSGVAGLVVLYFTGHRECITEANKIIDRRAVLQSELFTRDLNWKARIDQAKTPQEAFTMPDKRGSSHAELKDISYSDLETEFRNLMGRINYEDISGFDIARRLTWSDIIQPVIDKMYDEAHAPIDGKQPRMNPRRSLPF